MRKNLDMRAALTLAMASGINLGMLPDVASQSQPREKTDADRARIARAEEKRQRRAAKRRAVVAE